MKKFLYSVKAIIPKKQQLNLLLVFIGAFIISLLDTIGLGSIAGFVAIIADPSTFIEKIPNESIKLYLLNKELSFLVISLSTIILLIFLIKNIFIVLFHYFEIKINKRLTVDISTKLFHNYLSRPYVFHLINNPASLINTITTQVQRGVTYFFTVINIFREIVLITLLAFTLLLIDWQISLLFFFLLTLISLIFYKSFKNKLNSIGNKARILEGKELKSLNEGIGSIKYLIIKNKQKFFSDNYFRTHTNRQQLEIYHYLIGKLPRLFFEVIAVTIVLSVTLVFMLKYGSIKVFFPFLTLLGLIVIRIVPSFINLNSSFTSIQYHLSAIDKVVSELKIINLEKKAIENKNLNGEEEKDIKNISFQNVSYKYPGVENNTLNDISFEIEEGQMVGIIGKSGVGKSTLVNLILGLLQTKKGKIKFNSKDIDLNIINFRKQFGYVPQDIYLIDESIKKNIAFGLEDKEIDSEKVINCLKLSNLKVFVDSLPEGLETQLGDRGIRLSGGQKQRIGIARALYDDPKVLVMDEATSALDNETEEQVIEDILKFCKNKIVIFIAHRLTTLRNCHKFIFLESGKIIDQGTREEFLNRQKNLKPYLSEKK